MSIFPVPELTESEELELSILLNSAVYKKYLQILACSVADTLAYGAQGNQSDQDYCRNVAHHHGQLAVLDTLNRFTISNSKIEPLVVDAEAYHKNLS